MTVFQLLVNFVVTQRRCRTSKKHNLNSSVGIVGHYRFSRPHRIQTVSYPNAPIPLVNTPDPVQKSRIGGGVHLLRHTPSLRGSYQKHRDNFPSTGR
jgi:hypothetical protein